MIEVRNLRKQFGEVVAVDDVSFTVPDGQVTGLLGPNGAGKTTTLRALYGLVDADRGDVLVDGVNVASASRQARQRMGVLPDSRGLYVRLTAREHLRYYGRLQGLTAQAVEQSIERIVTQLEMEAIIDRRVAGFSHGERVKVAVGRALVHEPANVLLDEPTNGLDVGATRAMRRLIRGMRAAGKCVLFSSHIMQEVVALCDRIVIISCGRTVAQGTPDEILSATLHSNLEDAFVALTGIDEVGA
jgi:sodium transport system ATP-binding protein